MIKIYQIALNTYRESIRSKVLYSVLFFAVLMVLMSAFFGTVTIGDRTKVIKDFGLLSISFFAVAYAVIAGSSLLHKELYRKTIYNILAKPVARWQFLLGKHLGLVATTIVLVFLMGLGLILFLYMFDRRFDWLLCQAYLYIILELVIITAAVLLFSSIVVTPMLNGLFTFSIFVAGRSVDYIHSLREILEGDVAETLLNLVYWMLPHLNKLNISDRVVYGEVVSPEHMISAVIYCVGYAGVLLILASLAFRGREFN